MKKKLRVYEYQEIANDIKMMQALYIKVFRRIARAFPKNGKTMKDTLSLYMPISRLYFQIEREFLADYPDMDITDFYSKEEK